jgi:hypothetical protein
MDEFPDFRMIGHSFRAPKADDIRRLPGESSLELLRSQD